MATRDLIQEEGKERDGKRISSGVHGCNEWLQSTRKRLTTLWESVAPNFIEGRVLPPPPPFLPSSRIRSSKQYSSAAFSLISIIRDENRLPFLPIFAKVPCDESSGDYVRETAICRPSDSRWIRADRPVQSIIGEFDSVLPFLPRFPTSSLEKLLKMTGPPALLVSLATRSTLHRERQYLTLGLPKST